ncbi:MAG: hypothetical protein KJ795_07665 [Gammaproteobacteria bacterium]|nr:hypothetical protein [Gammaproteobacteria bacterium]MBU1776641.1 hypothetical protein [Gammaproteobacteria bacterium]MBU1969864.1 hypothetical protein [Gammaproteobacteria bacterium]
MDLVQRPNVLRYNKGRYLKLGGWLVLLAVAGYVLFDPVATESHGGTPMGYVLGILSLLIVFLLFWYGIHKRHPVSDRNRRISERRKPEGWDSDVASVRREQRRNSNPQQSWRYGQTQQGWLSLHINLGGALVVLATLHTGFEFGWNVHTLSYGLMMIVIASGFYGLYAYLNYPRLITDNMEEDTLESLLFKIDDLDEQARVRALDLPDDVNELVFDSRQGTTIGGGLMQQIFGKQSHCPTAFAVRQIRRLGQKYIADEQPKFMRELYLLLLRKERLVERARKAVMLQARLNAWLYLHVPLAIALLAALAVHVLSVLFFW